MVGSVNMYSPAPQVSDLFEEKDGKLVPILQVSRFSFSTEPDVAAELRHTFFWLAARVSSTTLSKNFAQARCKYESSTLGQTAKVILSAIGHRVLEAVVDPP